jgi:ribose transport system permease protein
MRSLRLFARYRIYLLLAAVCAIMAASAPNFASAFNAGTILKSASAHLLPAAGLTFVLVVGQIDLSFGACMTLGGMLAIGLEPSLGWPGGIAVAVLAGLGIGLANGALVTVARVNSFIATLGTMIIVQAAAKIYCHGGTLAVHDFRLHHWLDGALLTVLCPRALICIGLALALAALLHWTTIGRGFLLVGANPSTAWFAGLRPDRYVAGAFVLCGALSALGGAIFAASACAANPTMGDNSLMLVIAAVIIGGTSMKGGRGSVAASMAAVFMLVALIDGLSCFGAGFEAQLIASGSVMAGVVLYDAFVARRHELRRGARPHLMRSG